MYIHVYLLLFSLGLVLPCFDHLDQIDLGALLTVKICEEAGDELLHHALIFHQVRTKHFLDLRQAQVESSSDQLEKDIGQCSSEQGDDNSTDKLDANEAEIASHH